MIKRGVGGWLRLLQTGHVMLYIVSCVFVDTGSGNGMPNNKTISWTNTA